jgi:hypothetical protein
MMGLFSQAGSHIKRARGASVDDNAPEDTEPDDTSILSVSFHSISIAMFFYSSDPEYRDENEGSIISSLISQLR